MIQLAHGVGTVYELPIPLYLYLMAAGLTVAVSFAVRVSSRRTPRDRSPRRVAGPGAGVWIERVLRVAGIAGLTLIVAGAIVDPGRGFTLATLMFWVALVVGMTALSALVAGVWERADPWAALTGFLVGGARDDSRSPPQWVAPAVIYVLFWFELVSGAGFEGRGVLLAVAVYSVYTVLIRSIYPSDWRVMDPLYILFGFAGRSAPLEVREDGLYRKGVVDELDRADPMPIPLFAALFVLLASTTLDNARETVGWRDMLESLGLAGAPGMLVDSVALGALALPFLGTFLGAIALSPRGRDMALGERARSLGWSLIPIGIAYVLAHNASLLVAGVPRLVAHLGELVGVDGLFAGYAPSAQLVWYSQIAIIVGGHIVAVVAAHRSAIRMYDEPRDAIKSQYALTLLMSAFTIGTLWLLSLPLVRS